MNRLCIIIIIAIILNSFSTVFAQTGFVVYSKGSDCARQLTFNKLTDGKLGEEKVAVKKAEGADIWVQISYDGVWVAFGRAIGTFPSYSKHGDCDYHMFDKFDIYIAKIDHGRNLLLKETVSKRSMYLNRIVFFNECHNEKYFCKYYWSS